MRLATERSYTPERLESTDSDHCDLCKAEERAFIYHRDNICWVTECDKCRTPMAVLNRHREIPTPEDQQHMLRVLDHVMQTKGFNNEDDDPNNDYDYSDPKSIPDHYHIHARVMR